MLDAKTTSSYFLSSIQARIAQLVAYRLGTGKVPGSNPGKGENFSVKKILDCSNSNTNMTISVRNNPSGCLSRFFAVSGKVLRQ